MIKLTPIQEAHARQTMLESIFAVMLANNCAGWTSEESVDFKVRFLSQLQNPKPGRQNLTPQGEQAEAAMRDFIVQQATIFVEDVSKFEEDIRALRRRRQSPTG